MKFAKLAEYWERLEGTSGRLEMTRILAEVFKQVTPEEARWVAYMSQGRLGPAYKSADFGVADKMMVRALGKDAENVFKRTGDLGRTVEELKLQATSLKSQKSHNLTISQVYKQLADIAAVGGEGSQKRKSDLMVELLDRLQAKSAKYAVKIILGKLRTGFSDMTVLDSLSWMIKGDKSLRPEIEKMYNVRADLGEICEEMVRYKRPKDMEPEVGTPILMARAERASSAAEIWKRNGPCAVEYKLDGLRIQGHIKKPQVTLFSRGLEDVTAMYPDIVEGLKRQICEDCIVEGEMIAVGKSGKFLPFQETVQRKRKYRIEEMVEKVPLAIYLFDALVVNGTDMTHMTYWERRKKLESLVVASGQKSSQAVKLMSMKKIEKETEIEEFFAEALKDGCEGIMAKKLDGVYAAGARNFNWIKYKESYDKSALADTIDAVVMGYDMGQGKRAGLGIGDFLIGVYEPKEEKYLTVAKIGTGLTDEEWRELKFKTEQVALGEQNSKLKTKPENYEVSKQMGCDVWVRPKIVVEVQADEITRSPMHTSGYALRFPRFVGWREKKPEDTTALQEVEKLFKMQKGGGK